MSELSHLDAVSVGAAVRFPAVWRMPVGRRPSGYEGVGRYSRHLSSQGICPHSMVLRWSWRTLSAGGVPDCRAGPGRRGFRWPVRATSGRLASASSRRTGPPAGLLAKPRHPADAGQLSPAQTPECGNRQVGRPKGTRSKRGSGRFGSMQRPGGRPKASRSRGVTTRRALMRYRIVPHMPAYLSGYL